MTRARDMFGGLISIVVGAAAMSISMSTPALAAPAGELRGMLLKYTARCALAEGQFLEDAAGGDGQPARRYPGSLGLAPEWLAGTCGADCQERVSSCLIALTNRTGKHVELSLLSSAAGMGKALRPSAEDLPFPHQEGVFFGNVFTGQAFACRGRDVAKAPQVKRFCAIEPASCSGLAEFHDAGHCEDACEMSCQTMSDGSQRCAAVSCRDPEGHVWRSPMTTYLRNRIEAGNADEITGARQDNQALAGLGRGARARFEKVDFGETPGSAAQLVLTIDAQRAGRIEAWLDGRQRLGILDVTPSAGRAHEQALNLSPHRIAGSHSVLLKVVAGHDIGRVSTLELRD